MFSRESTVRSGRDNHGHPLDRDRFESSSSCSCERADQVVGMLPVMSGAAVMESSLKLVKLLHSGGKVPVVKGWQNRNNTWQLKTRLCSVPEAEPQSQ